jgi:F-type H+-transporting ATPase subunit a
MSALFTALLNTLLGAPVAALLGALGLPPDNPARPIPEYFAMQILVVAIIMILLAAVRSRLSVDRPGHLQQLMELTADGLEAQGEEIIGHGARQFVPLLFTLTLFIFLCNIIGLVPTLESPTGTYAPGTAFPMLGIYVTLGCSLVALVYYHYWGIQHHGVLGYLKTFMGPVLFIAPIMVPIELVSHLARGLSLSVRLFANMMAGQLVSGVFFLLVPLAIPAVFEALHFGVSLLQTYIFIILATVYLAGAVAEEH